MKINSISKALLTRVLFVYFILTFIVTCAQIGAEYLNTKSHINSELLTLEKTFSGSLTRAVWELNTQQALDIADGLVAIPMIKGILVRDENDQVIAELGQIDNAEDYVYKPLQQQAEKDIDYLNIESTTTGLFGHTFPLIFEFSGRTTRVGSVTLLSSNEVIFDRIQVGIYFLIGNAMLKTAALILLFSLAFNKLLTAPLNKLTDQMNQFDIDDPEASKLNFVSYENNEIDFLKNAYNNLINELVLYKERLAQSQEEVISANEKLDDHNMMLEQEVARKTSSLSTTMLEMETQQRELIKQQTLLEDENKRRRLTESTLKQTNEEFKSSIFELEKAQVRLLEAEKMAALGSLSAEVSHEITTPIAVSITSTSYLSEQLTQFQGKVKNNSMSMRSLEEFIKNSNYSIDLLGSNLNRASELIASYKQVAVDQTSDKLRLINMNNYIKDIIKSLHPKLKNTKHKVIVKCPLDLEITCHAGAISQIFTNLIINSLIHGFEGIEQGEMVIEVSDNKGNINITYRDNGIGVKADKLPKLFEPFYTTNSDKGGTGLGTHIVHNLVVDSLNGNIEAKSDENSGLNFNINFPIS